MSDYGAMTPLHKAAMEILDLVIFDCDEAMLDLDQAAEIINAQRQAAVAEAMAWRPIEEAKRDGTNYLLYCRIQTWEGHPLNRPLKDIGFEITQGFCDTSDWSNGQWKPYSGEGLHTTESLNPTHFMELLQPPQESQAARNHTAEQVRESTRQSIQDNKQLMDLMAGDDPEFSDADFNDREEMADLEGGPV